MTSRTVEERLCWFASPGQQKPKHMAHSFPGDDARALFPSHLPCRSPWRTVGQRCGAGSVPHPNHQNPSTPVYLHVPTWSLCVVRVRLRLTVLRYSLHRSQVSKQNCLSKSHFQESNRSKWTAEFILSTTPLAFGLCPARQSTLGTCGPLAAGALKIPKP